MWNTLQILNGARSRFESLRARILAKKIVLCASSVLSFAGTALPVANAVAYPETYARTVADGRLVDVQIKVDGSDVPLYFAPGRFDRHYFQAFAGRNYSLVLRNNTDTRIGVLIAVDGINVVNGERTSLGSTDPMYVLDPWEQAEIRGWRSSLDDVRRFVFVDEKRSYASRTGQANSDMGWIRVNAFREFHTVSWWNGWNKKMSGYRDGGSNAPRAEAAPPANEGAAPAPSVENLPAPNDGRLEMQKGAERERRATSPQSSGESKDALGDGGQSFPGTGWGDRRHDPVRRVEFTAERTATDRLVFRYEYASGLQALGIFTDRDRLRERDGQVGFAKPPRW